VLQELDAEARASFLPTLSALLPAGALAAFALVDESTFLGEGIGSTQVLPDMREVGERVYSSEPLWVQVTEEAMRVRRLRERVSPSGQIERSVHDDLLYRLAPERLEQEGGAAGFAAAGRRSVHAGPNEADSVVVLLEAQ
jgi:hypothetical protein